MEEALEQYLLLAKTAKGKAAESLITQALNNAHTFVFGELLSLMESSGASEEHISLLRIFSYGTYADYQSQAGSLPQLTPAQSKKLKMLTLATLAASEPVLPFESLQRTLAVDSGRELENIIIDSIYEGLIQGKIDHKQGNLQVMSAFGRDVPPENTPLLLGKLRGFLQHLERVEKIVEEQVNSVLSAKQVAILKQEEFKEKYDTAKSAARIEIESGMIEKPKKQKNEFAAQKKGFFR